MANKDILLFSGLTAAILAIFYLANYAKKSSKGYNDDLAESYIISSDGIEICSAGQPVKSIAWYDIEKMELHSRMPEFRFFRLFGCPDAIIIWTKSYPHMDYCFGE